MSTDRMMQAIGRMEQALDRLETTARPPEIGGTTAVADDAGRVRALAALQSLDSLIAELKADG